jgi:hypothetical protein
MEKYLQSSTSYQPLQMHGTQLQGQHMSGNVQAVTSQYQQAAIGAWQHPQALSGNETKMAIGNINWWQLAIGASFVGGLAWLFLKDKASSQNQISRSNPSRFQKNKHEANSTDLQNIVVIAKQMTVAQEKAIELLKKDPNADVSDVSDRINKGEAAINLIQEQLAMRGFSFFNMTKEDQVSYTFIKRHFDLMVKNNKEIVKLLTAAGRTWESEIEETDDAQSVVDQINETDYEEDDEDIILTDDTLLVDASTRKEYNEYKAITKKFMLMYFADKKDATYIPTMQDFMNKYKTLGESIDIVRDSSMAKITLSNQISKKIKYIKSEIEQAKKIQKK